MGCNFLVMIIQKLKQFTICIDILGPVLYLEKIEQAITSILCITFAEITTCPITCQGHQTARDFPTTNQHYRHHTNINPNKNTMQHLSTNTRDKDRVVCISLSTSLGHNM